MATIAVFIALGGSSYAAIQVTGKNVKDSSLTGADLRTETINSDDVQNGSLLGQDFAPGRAGFDHAADAIGRAADDREAQLIPAAASASSWPR